MTSFAKKFMLTGMVVLAVAGMAACGKKSQPKPPDGATFPRQYPMPEADKPKNP